MSSSSTKNGFPSERPAIASAATVASGAVLAPSIRAKTSSVSRGATSTTCPVTERRIPSARIRMRSREPISSTLAVATKQDRVDVDVMGQIDGQVDRRDVGPVHVLEHQEHGLGRRAFLEQR